MWKRLFSLSAFAAALLVAAPSVSEAQVRIGVGGGRGYYGGGYGGYGNRYGGYPGYYGGSGISIGVGTGYGGAYGPGYYGRGYSGYYGDGYYPGTGYYSSGTVINAGPSAPPNQAFYPPQDNSAPQGDGSASIAVRLPANAQLWWNGSATSAGGEMRLFRTSQLNPQGSTQRFQAQWMDQNGQVVNQTRDVQVMPNANVTVDFFQAQQAPTTAPAQTNVAPPAPIPQGDSTNVPPPPVPTPIR